MRIVAIINRKGGVGKTTTAVNLGAALALRGRRVLLIDGDPQANLSDHLGHGPEDVERSLYDVLTDDVDPNELIRETGTPLLELLPAHPDLAAAETELAGEIGRESRLRKALARIEIEKYDWVFIDCPPSLGLLSLNAMVAASELIITVQTEYFAMRGLGHVDEVIRMVQEHVNPDLRILGILPTLVNPVTRLSKEVLAEVRGHYKELVFRTKIRQNIRLAEAPGHQSHIFDYQPNSAGAKDYSALADELEGSLAIEDEPPATTSEPAQDEDETAETHAVIETEIEVESPEDDSTAVESIDVDSTEAQSAENEAIELEADGDPSEDTLECERDGETEQENGSSAGDGGRVQDEHSESEQSEYDQSEYDQSEYVQSQDEQVEGESTEGGHVEDGHATHLEDVDAPKSNEKAAEALESESQADAIPEEVSPKPQAVPRADEPRPVDESAPASEIKDGQGADLRSDAPRDASSLGGSESGASLLTSGLLASSAPSAPQVTPDLNDVIPDDEEIAAPPSDVFSTKSNARDVPR